MGCVLPDISLSPLLSSVIEGGTGGYKFPCVVDGFEGGGSRDDCDDKDVTEDTSNDEDDDNVGG